MGKCCFGKRGHRIKRVLADFLEIYYRVILGSVVSCSGNHVFGDDFYVCALLCVCSKEMTLPRGGESQEGNNVRQWEQYDRNSYSSYSDTYMWQCIQEQ